MDVACGRTATGSVECWGDNTNLQAQPPLGERFADIDLARYYGCGVTLDGWVVCWGTTQAAEVPSEYSP